MTYETLFVVKNCVFSKKAVIYATYFHEINQRFHSRNYIPELENYTGVPSDLCSQAQQ